MIFLGIFLVLAQRNSLRNKGCPAVVCPTVPICPAVVCPTLPVCTSVPPVPTPKGPPVTCSWTGHCLGATCVTFNDCSDDLICTNNKCATSKSVVTPVPTPKGTGVTPVPTQTAISPVPTAVPVLSGIPITFGNSATLTNFNDISTQCYGTNIPSGNGIAVNPLLLGFTKLQWDTIYVNASPSDIPWCGKKMTITVNSKVFVGTVIDTCQPTSLGGAPICDYENTIDLYTGGTSQGAQFIKSVNGDNFYQGALTWSIY